MEPTRQECKNSFSKRYMYLKQSIFGIIATSVKILGQIHHEISSRQTPPAQNYTFFFIYNSIFIKRNIGGTLIAAKLEAKTDNLSFKFVVQLQKKNSLQYVPKLQWFQKFLHSYGKIRGKH